MDLIDKAIEIVLKQIDEFKVNAVFDIRGMVRLYNSDFWKELGEQTQRDVGTEFKERVDNEDYPNIKFFDKTSDGRNWYQKIK